MNEIKQEPFHTKQITIEFDRKAHITDVAFEAVSIARRALRDVTLVLDGWKFLVTPSMDVPEIIEELRSILDRHNAREEDEGGLYDLCDLALGTDDSIRLVDELRTFPPIRLKPYNDGPAVEAHIRETLELSRQAWRAFSP